MGFLTSGIIGALGKPGLFDWEKAWKSTGAYKKYQKGKSLIDLGNYIFNRPGITQDQISQQLRDLFGGYLM